MIGVRARGVMEIEKRRKGEAEPYEVAREQNALVAAGVNHMLERIGGVSSADPLSSSSVLRIYDSGATLQKEITGTSAGPTHSVSGIIAQVVMEWVDTSDDEYDVHTGRVYFAGGAIQVNSATFAPTGSKGDDEEWTYRFTLTFEREGTKEHVDGIDRALRCVTGNSALTYSTSRTEIEIRDDLGAAVCEAGNLLGTMFASAVARVTMSGHPEVPDGEYLRWTFVDGGGLVGTWNCFVMRNDGGTPVELARAIAVEESQTAGNTRTLRVYLRIV